MISRGDLSTVIVAKADRALASKAVSPEAAKFNVGLWDVGVGQEKPDTEDGLSQNVKNGVGNDLSVNGKVSGAVGNTPDTAIVSIDQPDTGFAMQLT